MSNVSQAVANQLAVGQLATYAIVVLLVVLGVMILMGAVGRAYPFLFFGAGVLTFVASGFLYFTQQYPYILSGYLAPYEQYWGECLWATVVLGALFAITLWHVDRNPGGPHN